MAPGEPVSWDGAMWRIVNVGDHTISLLGVSGALTELPRAELQDILPVGASSCWFLADLKEARSARGLRLFGRLPGTESHDASSR